MASTSNIEILECLQSKASCMIVDTPQYVLNTVIWSDLQTPIVKEEICRYSYQYSTHKWPSSEPQRTTQQQQAIAKTPAK
jgi:hypothetical protein